MTARPNTADDPYRPYRAVGAALVCLVLLLIAFEFVQNALHPSDRDFIAFWGAARMVLSGSPVDAYDGSALRALQAQYVSFRGPAAEIPFPYPPAFLLLLLPFAALPFAAAMVAWSLTTLAVWLTVIRRMFPRSGWLALGFPPVYANAAVGQNGFLTAALLAGGLLLLPRRPFLAGLTLGCLVLKPQMALLLPIALLASRAWRAIVGAAVSAVAVVILGLLAFGPETWAAWISQLPAYAQIAGEGLPGWSKLVSVYGAARQAGLAAAPAMVLHAAVALLAAFAVWRVWRSDAGWLAKASVLASATMLASPHLFFYDTVILAVPLLFLAERKASEWLVAGLWLAPGAAIAMAATYHGPINISPLVSIVLLCMLWRRFRAGEDEAYARAAAPATQS